MAVLSINEVSTFRWTFDQDVTRYAAAGIGAMGVWRRKISDFGESRGIELLAEYNMRVSNLSWVGGFTGSDGRTFKESVEDAADGIRLAAGLRHPLQRAFPRTVMPGPATGRSANDAVAGRGSTSPADENHACPRMFIGYHTGPG